MSKIGTPEFEYPELVKVFGLSVVRKASVLHSIELRLLESSLAFHKQLAINSSRNLVADFGSLFN